MTIQNSICDSCGEPSDVLFPIAILDELPTGGMGMVKKYYCYSCYEDICEEAETNSKEKDEDEEDSPIDPINKRKWSSCYDALPKISWPLRYNRKLIG